MFSQFLREFDFGPWHQKAAQANDADVSAVLTKSHIALDDLPVLLSSQCLSHLDALAKRAQAVTRQRFGNTIQLYIPLYISNRCQNACLYCGFSTANRTPRKTLGIEEILDECNHIRNLGFRNLLLVSGETPELLQNNFLESIIKHLAKDFASLSIEVQPFDESVYRTLCEAGLDGVTLYQETYDPLVYTQVHPSGSKSNYPYRLDTMDRAAAAGVRKINIGALLGLGDPVYEAFRVALHCRYLLTRHWRSSVAISFPRMRESESRYRAPYPVDDRRFIQIMLAFRLVFPDQDLVLSTREPAALRDVLSSIAVTYMSAGSKTSPGAYTKSDTACSQFELEDTRSVEEIRSTLNANGLDVVWKDWNQNLNAQHILQAEVP